MGGGLMQLVAYGAQDIYLTGNPQITFFKVVYRRHTNFAIEAIEQTFNGVAAIGSKFTVTIARNGDLLYRVYLDTVLAVAGIDNQADINTGFKLIDYVEVEIGGQVIDKHYGEWLAIWCDLSHTADKLNLLKLLVDHGVSASATPHTYIPLQFWFNRNPGLALPLIALQYHEVKLNIQLRSASALAALVDASGVYSISSLSVYCDYIFLDTDERRRFAQVSHEYLIEQVQFSNDLTSAAGSNQHDLRFNHPVKELVWVNEASTEFGSTPVAGVSTSTLQDALIQLNGHDRFKRRNGDYFFNVQRYESHTGAGRLTTVNIYSFGLKPEEHQPSGTCNFSRIDNAIINYNLTVGSPDVIFRMWAVNYNVLRIMSGMGGLAYSN